MDFRKIKKWADSHRKTSIIIALVILFGGYEVYSKLHASASQVQYITAVAKKGTVVSAVTGTGQVSDSNRVDVVSEVSGDVVSVPVNLGDTVKEGQTLAYVDSKDASTQVQNAEISLENAKISYDKAVKNNTTQSVDSSTSDLNNAYDDGYTAVSNTMIDLPDVIQDLDDIYYNPNHSPYFGTIDLNLYAGQTALDSKTKFGILFDQTKNSYDTVFNTYRSISVTNKLADKDKLTKLIQDTDTMVDNLHSVLTETYNTINYVKDRIPANQVPAQIATDKSTINDDLKTINDHLTALSNALKDIENAQNSSATAVIDLKTAELNVSMAQDNLTKANDDLANHNIKAPFDGIVGKVDVKTGDKIANNGAVATIITNDKVAEVSLNEVDISKVKIGQKVTITFDAIDGLTLQGTVKQIDLLGTVNQGVVDYTVQIAFDQNDDRVKTGMSLSASIVSDTKDNVLRVPNSAVKSQGNRTYVEEKNTDGTVKRVPVVTGISGDEYTEIVSGLNEGDTFISRTISTSATTATTAQAPSLFGTGGGGGNRTFGTGAAGGGTRTQTQTGTR